MVSVRVKVRVRVRVRVRVTVRVRVRVTVRVSESELHRKTPEFRHSEIRHFQSKFWNPGCQNSGW